MNIEIILLGLLVVSTLTGLTTEAIKNTMKEYGKSYKANTLAGVVSLILSVAVSFGYGILNKMDVSDISFIVCVICLVFLSWLCAMVGYDKVIQSISQFKKYE